MFNSVNILGCTYDISLMDDYIDIDNPQFIGRINPREQVIYIDTRFPVQQQEKTLLHEVIHGILNESGYTDESQNEQLVEALATGLYLAFGSAIFTSNIQQKVDTIKSRGGKKNDSNE